MAIKVWSLVLVAICVFLLLLALVTGLIPLLNFALLTSVVMILLATYVSLTRKDPSTKVPTPLELEKMKRRLKAEESGILLNPGKKS